VTDPQHHRRGAGSMLIKWGTSQADIAQLPCFLESSVMGRPLYASHGYTPRHEEVFDLSKYGGEGEDMNTVMIRDPVQT
jgi:predicted N-acetyltransferase YhbS